MQFNPTRLELSGFKSFDSMQVLELDLDPGLHYITGRNDREPRLGANGAGKSALWDAFSWVLYGKTIGGLKGTDITPWQKGEKTEVALYFRDGKGDRDAISCLCRTLNPSRLTLNDCVVGQDDIDAKIGMSFELFSTTMLLGQARPLFLDLPPTEQMNLISDALGLQRWLELSDAAKAKAAEATGRIVSLTHDKAVLEGELKQLEEMVLSMAAKAKTWTDKAKADVAAAEKARFALADPMSQVLSDYENGKMRLEQLGLKLRDLSAIRGKHSGELAQALATFKMVARDHKAQLERKAELESDLKTIKAGNCPTCGQALKADHQKHVKGIAEKLDKASKSVARLAAEYQKLKAAVPELEKQANAFQKDEHDTQTAMFAKEGEMKTLAGRKATLEAKLNALNDIMEAGRKNPFLAALGEQRTARTEKLKAIAAKADSLAAAERVQQGYSYWVKGFRDLRLHIVGELLDELSIVVNGDLAEIGLEGWEVQFSAEKVLKSGEYRQALNLEIRNPDGKAARFESWSGGEGQRLRLVAALGLAEVLLGKAGVRVDMTILDEPSRHLSVEGNADLTHYLASRAKRLGQRIFLTDHQTRRSVHFQTVTTVIKGEAGSVIEARM